MIVTHADVMQILAYEAHRQEGLRLEAQHCMCDEDARMFAYASTVLQRLAASSAAQECRAVVTKMLASGDEPCGVHVAIERIEG